MLSLRPLSKARSTSPLLPLTRTLTLTLTTRTEAGRRLACRVGVEIPCGPLLPLLVAPLLLRLLRLVRLRLASGGLRLVRLGDDGRPAAA